MEPNQPVQPQLLSPEQLPKPSKLPVILLTLISILSLSGLVYFYFQAQSLKQQLSSQSPSTLSTTATTKSSTNTDPTVNWQTYTNNQYGFLFKYPKNWKEIEHSSNFERNIIFDNECQRISILVSDAIQRELNVDEYAKQTYSLTDSDVSNVKHTLPSKYLFKFTNIPESDYFIVGPLGEGELNNLIVKGPEGHGYLEIKIFSNSSATGSQSPEVCYNESSESEYQQLLSTLQFTDSQ